RWSPCAAGTAPGRRGGRSTPSARGPGPAPPARCPARGRGRPRERRHTAPGTAGAAPRTRRTSCESLGRESDRPPIHAPTRRSAVRPGGSAGPVGYRTVAGHPVDLSGRLDLSPRSPRLVELPDPGGRATGCGTTTSGVRPGARLGDPWARPRFDRVAASLCLVTAAALVVAWVLANRRQSPAVPSTVAA